MSKTPKSHDIPADAPEYVETWARDIVAAIGKREARKLLADYEALAGNKRLAKADRDVSTERVKALKKLL